MIVMSNPGPSRLFLFASFVCAVLISSTLSADPLTDEMADQLVEQVADLKTEPKESPAPLLLLVSQGELDALPMDTVVSWSSTPTSPEGPLIEIASPMHNGTYEGPFPIKVSFLPGPKGYAVDIDTLKLEYKKAWGIDITDRVRDFVAGNVIDVKESELPRGRHTVEIEISDTENNLSRQIFTVTVK
jgi:hypothetical protein